MSSSLFIDYVGEKPTPTERDGMKWGLCLFVRKLVVALGRLGWRLRSITVVVEKVNG